MRGFVAASNLGRSKGFEIEKKELDCTGIQGKKW